MRSKARVRAFFAVTLAITDVAMAALAFVLAYWIRRWIPWPEEAKNMGQLLDYATLVVMHVLSIVTIFGFSGQYHVTRTSSRVDEFYAVFKSSSVATLMGVALSSLLFKNSSLALDYSRGMVVYGWGATIILVMVGRLIHNIQQYPRIIGGINEVSTHKAMELYKHIVKSTLHPTDSLTAEIAKVVENTYRDVNIAFANEVGLMCESLGVDVFTVRNLVNTLPNDPSNPAANPVRNMHFAGAGVGGHCLPKDPWLLKYGVDTYGKFKVDPEVIIGSRKLNMKMPEHMIKLLEEAMKKQNKSIKNAKIAVLGVAFLENSDDTRNTPTKTVFEKLKAKNANPILHDPYVREFEYPFTKNLQETLHQADAVLLMVKHKDYLNLNLNELKETMNNPIFIDGRNAFNKEKIEKEGFTYLGVGKPH